MIHNVYVRSQGGKFRFGGTIRQLGAVPGTVYISDKGGNNLCTLVVSEYNRVDPPPVMIDGTRTFTIDSSNSGWKIIGQSVIDAGCQDQLTRCHHTNSMYFLVLLADDTALSQGQVQCQ